MSAPAASPPPPAGDPYAELLAELDRSVQAIRAAALRLKKAAEGMQAVERNADRVLASTRMLQINVSDLVGDTDGFASWEDDTAPR